MKAAEWGTKRGTRERTHVPHYAYMGKRILVCQFSISALISEA